MVRRWWWPADQVAEENKRATMMFLVDRRTKPASAFLYHAVPHPLSTITEPRRRRRRSLRDCLLVPRNWILLYGRRNHAYRLSPSLAADGTKMLIVATRWGMGNKTPKEITSHRDDDSGLVLKNIMRKHSR